MPLYEYKCSGCGYELEVLVFNSGDIPHTCPKCGTGDIVKQISRFAINTRDSGNDFERCAECPSAAACPHTKI